MSWNTPQDPTEPQSKLPFWLSFLLLNLLGNGLYAVGVHCFTQPHNIAPGGLTGVATILNYLVGLPIGTGTFLMNIPLLILAWRHLGKRFAVGTTLSIAISSLMIDLAVTPLPQYQGDPLLAALFGGACMGTGLAFIDRSESTTGGTTIIGYLIQKRYPQFPIGQLLMYANLVVVGLSVLTFHTIESALYSALTIYISSTFMDKAIYGFETRSLLLIISERNEAISARILQEMHRGTTFLNGKGGYHHQEKEILLCVVRRTEYYRAKRIVQEVDPRAFVIVSDANDVMGKGFHSLSV